MFQDADITDSGISQMKIKNSCLELLHNHFDSNRTELDQLMHWDKKFQSAFRDFSKNG